jgi:hypothetical protein
MSSGSTQAAFSANLAGTPLGTAVYHPVPFNQRSGRVGDIAFFDENGGYKWIRNAFDDEVLRFFLARLQLTDSLGAIGLGLGRP